MDNMSSAGGENLSGAPGEIGAVPNSFEQKFGPSELEQRSEQRRFGAQAELGRGALEATPFTNMPPAVGAEAAELGYGDANAQMTEVNGEILGTDLKVNVKDNDRLEPDIAAQVERKGKEIEKNPHDGANDWMRFKKEYWLKRWNRVHGERNDGSKVDGLNVSGGKAA